MERSIRNEWQRLWRILTNPTVEVVAAMLVMLAAAWIIVEADALPPAPYAGLLFAK